MTAEQMLAAAKLALRIVTNAYDNELTALLNAAMRDLGIAGVEIPGGQDDLVQTACITYVKMRFGSPDNYDRLKAAYDEQKAQLMVATGYTEW